MKYEEWLKRKDDADMLVVSRKNLKFFYCSRCGDAWVYDTYGNYVRCGFCGTVLYFVTEDVVRSTTLRGMLELL